jgi:DNA polymerase bacteriophage-type
MSEWVGLDFETYSAANLKTHGLARYVEAPTFTPLLACVAGEHGVKATVDFTTGFDGAKARLEELLDNNTICAHNVLFEKAVLDRIGLHYPSDRFIDTAVIARAAGGSGSLEQAARQLLGGKKLDSGHNLIKLFCVPSKKQIETGQLGFDPNLVDDYPTEWARFVLYCSQDAMLSRQLAAQFRKYLTQQELIYAVATLDMNELGWCVDMDLVKEMQRQYESNQFDALEEFRFVNEAPDLNLNSLKQMKEWCLDRGVKATSFDEKHVAALLKRIDKRLAQPNGLTPDKVDGYRQVRHVLETKQILGGSSLKKLQTIIDTSQPDVWRPGTHRLKDQYLHCGAGQTLRTTGRGVQMQNLKRLGNVNDVDEIMVRGNSWSNEMLASNLRQVFTASDKAGALIVGDFSSVESRGLAYLAHETWKLLAYRGGQDLYKTTASKIYNVPYEDVTKQQRQAGKVGELSCGYGAGSGAVQSFAEGMGIEMSEGEAAKLVWDWRDANPRIVEFWSQLDVMLKDCLATGKMRTLQLADRYRLEFSQVRTPDSLLDLRPDAQSVCMAIRDHTGEPFMLRYFHGCYGHGRNICYHRPSERMTGVPWNDTFINPKTKARQRFELYGGKLAGILTQSLCRELFFQSLNEVHRWCASTSQVDLIGQFHDEIVLDWRQGSMDLVAAKLQLERLMSDPGYLTTFPLAADVKSSYRYIK